MFGVAFTCGFSSLVAQRAHQFEFGAFGSFTRYDKVFNLDSQIGGGGRLGYFFENIAPYRFTDNAVHGAIGDRIFLGDRAALRFEVRGFYTPNTGFAGGDWAGHVVGSLGLSVFTRSGPAADQDHDGVPDRRDACPDTPVGATIDARGCPTDSDRDGVYDGLDQCPGTPAGA